MGIIYKITNLINDKIYVGQHKTSADDGYLGSGTILKRAINLYGKENFNRETLEFVDETNIDDRETYWITQLSATTYYGNYNITSGGHRAPVLYGKDNAMWGKKRPEIAKIMSELRKGVPLSEEHKGKIKKQMQNYVGENNPAKRSESRKKISNNAVKVIVSINGVIYNGITDASKQLNINRSTVKQRLNSTSEKFKDWKKIGYLNAEENKRYN